MFIRCNPNPLGKQLGDCVVRAIAIATSQGWRQTYDELCEAFRQQNALPEALYLEAIRNTVAFADQCEDYEIDTAIR